MPPGAPRWIQAPRWPVPSRHRAQQRAPPLQGTAGSPPAALALGLTGFRPGGRAGPWPAPRPDRRSGRAN
eukprot:3146752-Alexandrium_andersonii.AAC.1